MSTKMMMSKLFQKLKPKVHSYILTKMQMFCSQWILGSKDQRDRQTDRQTDRQRETFFDYGSSWQPMRWNGNHGADGRLLYPIFACVS
jgi:hypothetical protein